MSRTAAVSFNGKDLLAMKSNTQNRFCLHEKKYQTFPDKSPSSKANYLSKARGKNCILINPLHISMPSMMPMAN